MKQADSNLYCLEMQIILKKPNIYQTYDPLSIINLKRGTYPKKSDLIKELDSYKKALEINGVDVYELDSVPNCNQIFARDIGFVIGITFYFQHTSIEAQGNQWTKFNTD